MSNFGSRVSALVETTRSSYRLHVYRFKYTHVYIYIYIFYVVYSKFLFQFFYCALFFINIYEKSIIVRLLGEKKGGKKKSIIIIERTIFLFFAVDSSLLHSKKNRITRARVLFVIVVATINCH